MAFLLVAFISGVLTVLAPCVLPLLPVVIGSSASGRSRFTPYIVVGSLALSIVVFTYALKASTAFIMVPPEVWTYISGGILTVFGLVLVFPMLWEHIPGMSLLSGNSNKMMGAAYMKKSFWGDVLVGAALGPVFSTCSPTFFVILATVLPASFALGSLYILAYTLGLCLVLLLVGIFGQKLTSKLSFVADPMSPVKRWIGVLFILLGLAIAFGYEKRLETAILNSGFFDVTKIENRLLESAAPLSTAENDGVQTCAAAGSCASTTAPIAAPTGTNPAAVAAFRGNAPVGVPYKEIVNPGGFVNTDGITLGSLVGKKIILVDFLAYSCINCQRTFPYLNAWYAKYKDQGFEIVGIHTPEFAFERSRDNLVAAAERFGLKFPVVMDNEYGTWSAYKNRFWPHKYLIDIHGNIVYDHIGEGAYDETERKIQELLKERAQALGEKAGQGGSLAASGVPQVVVAAASPETYFGSSRNELLANGQRFRSGVQQFTSPDNVQLNSLYLSGTWDIQPEHAQASMGARITYRYVAKEVYFVADADMPVEMEVWQDGKLIGTAAGSDVNAQGAATIKESRLYHLVHNAGPEAHVLELRIRGAGLRAYTFTFG